MSKEFWNERYAADEYAYGIEANDFLKEHRFRKNGKILCLAEGEGRNAVYLAQQGYQVTCVDFSQEGVNKTNSLAKIKSVDVNAVCVDLNEYELGEDQWDGIVIIFGHFPPELRKKVHGNLYKALKSGGQLVMESYHKEQLNFKTGGPQQADLLYNRTELLELLNDFESIEIHELKREVNEGKFHSGLAAVVQVIAQKK